LEPHDTAITEKAIARQANGVGTEARMSIWALPPGQWLYFAIELETLLKSPPGRGAPVCVIADPTVLTVLASFRIRRKRKP
jgi:hypothetical protein